MEPNPKFDLNQAIVAWKNSLLESSAMSPDSIRELETHLIDSMDKLVSGGLNSEEAFLLATRRLGAANELDSEFNKVNHQQIWENRAMWIIFAMQSVKLATALSSLVFYGCLSVILNYLDDELRHPIGATGPLLTSVMEAFHWVFLAGILFAAWRFITRASVNLTTLMRKACGNPLLVGGALLISNLILSFLTVSIQIFGHGPSSPRFHDVHLPSGFYISLIQDALTLPIILTWLLHRSGRFVKPQGPPVPSR